jgi:hypothetical protein
MASEQEPSRPSPASEKLDAAAWERVFQQVRVYLEDMRKRHPPKRPRNRQEALLSRLA